jgi:hypothetical protein
MKTEVAAAFVGVGHMYSPLVTSNVHVGGGTANADIVGFVVVVRVKGSAPTMDTQT